MTYQQPIQPTDIDILCGRGKAFANHPGNIKFTQTIESNLQKYRDTPKRIQRSVILAGIVDQFLDKGIRFLREDKAANSWVELSVEKCHEKVGHALRDLNRKTKVKCSFKSLSSYAVVSSKKQHNDQIAQRNFNLILENPFDSIPGAFPNKQNSNHFEATESTPLTRLIECVLAEDENFDLHNSMSHFPSNTNQNESFSFRASSDFNNFNNRHDLTQEESLQDFRF